MNWLFRNNQETVSRAGLAGGVAHKISTNLGWVLAATGLVFLLGLSVTALYHLRQQRRNDLEAARRQLDAIADLKLGQIITWRQEREHDAALFFNPVFARNIQTWLTNSALPVNTSLQLMESLQQYGQYERIQLYDGQLKLQRSYPPAPGGEPVDPAAAELLREARHTNQIVFSALHRFDATGQIYLDMAVPLWLHRPPTNCPVTNPPVGVVFFEINAATFIFPKIQKWPTLSRTAETMIIRREGDEVVYLNELRHRHHVAFVLRQPLAGNNSISARVARGETGTLQGDDYRGVPVLAAVRSVPGRRWIMISKVDLDEIDAPLHTNARSFAIVSGALLLAISLAMGLIWRNRDYQFSLRELAAQRQMAETLRQGADRLHSFAAATFEGICITEGGKIVDVNEQFQRMLGCQPGELMGRELPTCVAPESRSRVSQALDSEASDTIQAALLRPDGVLVETEIRVRLSRWDGRRLSIIAVRDITARVRLENQLRQLQKMEAVGRLVGGVAHDFNNILTAVLIHLGLLKDDAQVGPQVKKSLTDLEREASRGTALTRQLLLFSRQKVAQPRLLDLELTVKDLAKMLERILGETVRLRLGAVAGSAWIWGDPGMIEQVILNLCVNARDAMPQGGTVTLATAMLDLGEAAVRANPQARVGRFVCLSVCDTGSGMEPAVLEHLFEPFFTTKAPGKGTGLGLATSYGIVKQHDGWIEVESVVGRGSTFRIFLPAAAESPAAQAPVENARPVRGGSEIILLVEDDLATRQPAALCLRRLGYAVLEAGCAGEAARLWRQHEGRIDLLLTDLVMPGRMDGVGLARTLRREQAGLRVIVSTGYAVDGLGRPGLPQDEEFIYLSKPHDAVNLANAVRDCLDRPSRA